MLNERTAQTTFGSCVAGILVGQRAVWGLFIMTFTYKWGDARRQRPANPVFRLLESDERSGRLVVDRGPNRRLSSRTTTTTIMPTAGGGRSWLAGWLAGLENLSTNAAVSPSPFVAEKCLACEPIERRS